MIVGIVTPFQQAIIRLPVRGPLGQEEVEAVIDTGFNGFLMLPPELITRLGLMAVTMIRATLADGAEVELRAYEVTVLWDQEERILEALQTDGDALIGMSLLQGYDVRIQVVDGGTVMIEALV